MKSKSIIRPMLATAIILLIPLLLMKFHVVIPDPGGESQELAWTVSDFIFAGLLLCSAGLAYELATMNVGKKNHRISIAVVVLTILTIIWIGAATGFEGIFDRIDELQS